MVFSLILILLIIVFIALFVGFNLSNTCTLWLFKTFENLPVSVLVFVAFAAGIVVALLFLSVAKIKRSSKSADKEKEVDSGENNK